MDEFPLFQFGRMIEALLKAYEEERRIFVMGNGGSASTASHWVCDINKGCCLNLTKKFKMLCLNDSISTMLAYANDLSYSHIFLEQLKNFFVPGDVVIGISGSGNSKNVINAIDFANASNGITIGLCGFSGGRLGRAVHIPIIARASDMQKIEDFHMVIVHMSVQNLASRLNMQPQLSSPQATRQMWRAAT